MGAHDVMRPYTWTKGSIPPEDRIIRRLVEAYGPLNPDACWIWPGATRKGYGCVQTGSRRDGTRMPRDCHVVLWEAQNGPTPEGMELHHACMTTRLCCNPAHMKPVTHQVNSVLVTEETRQKRRDALVLAREVRWM